MLRHEIRFALRTLRKSPGFTLATILTLALGIGANSAIFSVVNAVLLRPLAFERPAELVSVLGRDARGRVLFPSRPDFDDWKAQSRTLSDLACFVGQSVNLTGIDEPTRVIGTFVSANFFPLLGISPALGRGFRPEEDLPGGQRVTIVKHELWQSRFGGDPKLLGRSLNLNGELFTVVGVLPKGFVFPFSDADVYLPHPYYPNYSRNRADGSCGALGRMKAGVLIEQAQAEMDTIASGLAAQYPDTNKGRGIRVQSYHEALVEDVRPIVIALLGAVGFVLLIGCVNVANLLLSRMIGRSRESAVRAALGASRSRLAGALVTEAVILALAGGALGLLLGLWGVDLLSVAGEQYLPAGMTIALDRAVVAFTLALSLATAVLVALIPALHLFRTDWNLVLREGRGAGTSAGRNRVRHALVVLEIALALVLLAGSGLMIRTFLELGRVPTGYDPRNVLTLEYRIPRAKYPQGAQQAEFHRMVVERVAALPGVTSATSVRAVPLGGNGSFSAVFPADRPEPAANEMPRALHNMADPNYFRTMRIPILQGRVFTEQDSADAQMAVVINQTQARRFWPGQNPIGKMLRLPAAKVTAQVIGVVADVKHFSPGDLESAQVYGALAQNPFIFTSLAVRTAGDPMQMANAVRQAVWSVDKDQPVWKVRTMESMLDAAVSPRWFIMLLLGGYAGLALLLAGIGIFGVVSYVVGQRTPEIGIRMALGADRAHVLGMVMGQGLLLTVAGVALGLAGAAGLTRFLATQLYGVRPTDPLTLALAALVLAAVSLTACALPARRASRVDPTVALRYE